MIAVVAIAPATILAFEPSFVHASVLDPSVPLGSSSYLAGIGFINPWLITEVPASMKHVTLSHRIFPGQLAGLYLLSLIVVAGFWSIIRLVARTINSTRRKYAAG